VGKKKKGNGFTDSPRGKGEKAVLAGRPERWKKKGAPPFNLKKKKKKGKRPGHPGLRQIPSATQQKGHGTFSKASKKGVRRKRGKKKKKAPAFFSQGKEKKPDGCATTVAIDFPILKHEKKTLYLEDAFFSGGFDISRYTAPLGGVEEKKKKAGGFGVPFHLLRVGGEKGNNYRPIPGAGRKKSSRPMRLSRFPRGGGKKRRKGPACFRPTEKKKKSRASIRRRKKRKKRNSFVVFRCAGRKKDCVRLDTTRKWGGKKGSDFGRSRRGKKKGGEGSAEPAIPSSPGEKERKKKENTVMVEQLPGGDLGKKKGKRGWGPGSSFRGKKKRGKPPSPPGTGKRLRFPSKGKNRAIRWPVGRRGKSSPHRKKKKRKKEKNRVPRRAFRCDAAFRIYATLTRREKGEGKISFRTGASVTGGGGKKRSVPSVRGGMKKSLACKDQPARLLRGKKKKGEEKKKTLA